MKQAGSLKAVRLFFEFPVDFAYICRRWDAARQCKLCKFFALRLPFTIFAKRLGIYDKA